MFNFGSWWVRDTLGSSLWLIWRDFGLPLIPIARNGGLCFVLYFYLFIYFCDCNAVDQNMYSNNDGIARQKFNVHSIVKWELKNLLVLQTKSVFFVIQWWLCLPLLNMISPFFGACIASIFFCVCFFFF